MLPWVREKFAESRLRWQNRKQRNENYNPLTNNLSTTPTTIATTVSETVAITTSNTSSVLAPHGPMVAIASTSYADNNNSLKRPTSLLTTCKTNNDHSKTQRR